MSPAYILHNCQHSSATKTYSASNFLCSSDAELLEAPVRQLYSLLRQLCDMLQPTRRHSDPRETSRHDMLPWAINSQLALAARRTFNSSVPIEIHAHRTAHPSTSSGTAATSSSTFASASLSHSATPLTRLHSAQEKWFVFSRILLLNLKNILHFYTYL